jgi:GT2 family glycosyltransferase
MDDKVCVLMLNWNTPEMTYECIQSVNETTYKNYEICLFDNGSSENNYEQLNSLIKNSAKIYRIKKNIGYVGGMNYALNTSAQYKPGYFLIMNNDTILNKNAMSALVATAKNNNNNCVVTGKVYHYNDPSRIQTVGNTFNKNSLESKRIGFNEIDNGQFDMECDREMIDDVFMLLPYDIYIKVGGYNPYLYLNYEQTDLIIRIKEAGYKVI